MKIIILAFSTFIMMNAFAGQPKAPLFNNLAVKVTKELYGKKGDTVVTKLINLRHSEKNVSETWEVILSNGANSGSAVYQVNIDKDNEGSEEGDDVASIRVKYLFGN